MVTATFTFGGGGGRSETRIVESAETRRLRATQERISRELWEQYKTFGLPALKSYTKDAEDYASPGRLGLETGFADTAVQQAYASERAGLRREFARYGMQGRLGAGLRTLALGAAGDRAGARTATRHGVIDRGMGHRLNAINLWSGHPGNAISALNSALQSSSQNRTIIQSEKKDMDWGQILGEGVGTLAGAAAYKWILSDRRLKKDIKRVGELSNDLPVYEFRYRDGNDQMYTGCMADEVLTVEPDLVKSKGGYLFVNYHGLIDREMARVVR